MFLSWLKINVSKALPEQSILSSGGESATDQDVVLLSFLPFGPESSSVFGWKPLICQPIIINAMKLVLKCKTQMGTALIIGICARCPHHGLSEIERRKTWKLLNSAQRYQSLKSWSHFKHRRLQALAGQTLSLFKASQKETK